MGISPVLITGCSSGIGQATAARLGKQGVVVYATARRPETLTGLRAAGCRTLPLDVTDEESMRSAVREIEADHGRVGALVNNAGYGEYGAVETVGIEAVRRQFETNVFGPAFLTQLVLPGMRRAGGGRIVNVSSMGGRLVFPGGGWYHASKFALEALSDALRVEVAPFGIGVSLVEPGLIRTGFENAAGRALGERDGTGSAYEAFHRGLREGMQRGYRSRTLTTSPDAVAKVIERALTSARPRARYVVTPAARALILLRRLAPDAVWDAYMRAQFAVGPAQAMQNSLPSGSCNPTA